MRKKKQKQNGRVKMNDKPLPELPMTRDEIEGIGFRYVGGSPMTGEIAGSDEDFSSMIRQSEAAIDLLEMLKEERNELIDLKNEIETGKTCYRRELDDDYLRQVIQECDESQEKVKQLEKYMSERYFHGNKIISDNFNVEPMMEMPIEIVNKIREVEMYFKEQGIKDWCYMGLASRDIAQRWYRQMQESQAEVNELKKTIEDMAMKLKL